MEDFLFFYVFRLVAGTFFTTDYINERCFRCLDDSFVVSSKKVCDGIFDCKDLSDECLCANNRPRVCQQTCKGKIKHALHICFADNMLLTFFLKILQVLTKSLFLCNVNNVSFCPS